MKECSRCTAWPLLRQPPRDTLNLQQVFIHHRLFCDDILCPGSQVSVALRHRRDSRRPVSQTCFDGHGFSFLARFEVLTGIGKSCGMWRRVAGRTFPAVAKDLVAFIFVVNHYKKGEDGGATVFRNVDKYSPSDPRHIPEHPKRHLSLQYNE